jgi:hypothetical protein
MLAAIDEERPWTIPCAMCLSLRILYWTDERLHVVSVDAPIGDSVVTAIGHYFLLLMHPGSAPLLAQRLAMQVI